MSEVSVYNKDAMKKSINKKEYQVAGNLYDMRVAAAIAIMNSEEPLQLPESTTAIPVEDKLLTKSKQIPKSQSAKPKCSRKKKK